MPTAPLLLLALFSLHAASSASPLDAFLPPRAATRATGGDLRPPFAVANAEACAAACLAEDGGGGGGGSCISFSLDATAQPPTRTCGIVEECWSGNASSCPSFLTLSCVGGTFTAVAFASYGLPIVEPGACSFEATPTCDAPSARAVFEAACVGRSWCSVDAQLATFGVDPCVGKVKFIAAALVGDS
jgi:hypothetical protein